MIKIKNKTDCCGCSACEQICPKHAIKMRQDKEGFYYPYVDRQNCVDCHLCEKVCPVKHPAALSERTREVFVCQNLNQKIRRDSTSGGAFSAIAKYVLDRGGVVFGAALDQHFCVVHKEVETYEDLRILRGSKYVQSNPGNTFKTVKKLLNEERLVCYSGTPCQIEGLNAFLQHRYDNLILVDLVCYTISSPLVWKQYLRLLEKEKKITLQQVSNVKFRDKNPYGYEYTRMTFYDMSGNVCYSSGSESNEMLRSFVSNTSTRPSCYKCKFKKVKRVSDFTIWDCYNIYQYDKKMDDNLGSSHVMVHTQKGKEILDQVTSDYLKVKKVNLEFAVNSEPAMTQCALPGKNRREFFAMMAETHDGEALTKFFPLSLKVKIERILRENLSKINLYQFVKRAAITIFKK